MKALYKQEIRVWKYLCQHGKITSLIALPKLGIMDLPKRISVLIRSGKPIGKKFITVKNRFGERCRVMEYRRLRA